MRSLVQEVLAARIIRSLAGAELGHCVRVDDIVEADAFELAELDVGDVDDRLHPTLPSSDIAISFCASTANSIGNC